MPPQKLNACRLCGFGFVAAVLALIGWSWYCFTVLVWVPQLPTSPAVASLALLVFHALLSLLLASYLRCVFTDPGGVPESFVQVEASQNQMRELEAGAAEPGESNARHRDWGRHVVESEPPPPRFCKKCVRPKPDRSHHCSLCKRCVLKMDHHCPWVNNCVGFANQKYFVLFLLYVCATIGFLLIMNLSAFLACFAGMDTEGNMLNGSCQYTVMFNYFVMVSVELSIFFFAAYHVYLVTSGSTTIERFEKDRETSRMIRDRKRRGIMDTPGTLAALAKSQYDRGRRLNWEEVMGPSPRLWFLPTRKGCVGDGCSWPTSGTPSSQVAEGEADITPLVHPDPHR